MNRRMGLFILGAILMVSLLFSIYYVEGIQGFAVVPPEYERGKVTKGTTETIDFEFCANEEVDNLRFVANVYGPNAQSLPCKESIDTISLSQVTPSSLSAGQCADYRFQIDTSSPEYEVGPEYSVVISAFSGNQKIDVRNSATDDRLYQSCMDRVGDELKDSDCAKDDEGRYYFCQGIAWAFDLESGDGEEETYWCISEGECIEMGSSGRECYSTQSKCEANILDEDGDDGCVEGNTENYTCEDGTNITTYKCEDGKWIETDEECPSEISIMPLIAIISLGGVVALIYYGRRERWF